MQFEDASRRMRRLALVLATLVALPTLLPTSAAAGTGAARHEQRSELAGRTARSHITLLALGPGSQRPGGPPAVRTLQRRLTRLGYAPGPVDGRFGPRTEAAVIAFQTRQGLTADGLVGPRTGARLHALRTTVSRGVGLDRRHGAPRVRSLQRRLQRLGYHPGPLDGRFGPRTEAAVIAFQRDHRLVGDGIAGPLTYAALRTTRPTGQTPARPQPSPSPTAPSPQPSPPTQTAPTQTARPTPTSPSQTPPTQTQPAPPAQTPTTPPAQTPAQPPTQTQPVPAEPTGGSVPSLAAVVLIALAALVLAVVVIAVLPFLLVSGTGRRPRPRRPQRRPAGAPPDSLTPKRPPNPPPEPATPPAGASNGNERDE